MTCDAQLAALRAHFRVIRYDTRGHGRSSVAPGPYKVAQLGADVVHLLDFLAIGRAHFCGMSIGGLTGMWLALQHPDRIRRLVSSNTAALMGRPGRWTVRADVVRREGMAAIAAAVAAQWLTPDYAARSPAVVAALVDMVSAMPVEGYVASCLAVRNSDLRAQVGAICLPTLVIAGLEDPATPPLEGRYLRHQIPGAVYVELDAAHLSNLERPVAFSAAVGAFLRGA